MIIEVTEFNFKGITLYHVPNKGWKCTLGDAEYLFPNCQEAQSAINDIFNVDIKGIAANHRGIKIKK